MRRLLTLTTLVGLFAALGMADMFNGKLIDATCLDKPNPTLATCQPSASTGTFALVDNSQRIFRLDAQGNAKAADALRHRPDQQAEPSTSGKTDTVSARS
ncbi:MAG: hypothetical protein WDO73_16510 [Ignavibacteriota bacterium]